MAADGGRVKKPLVPIGDQVVQLLHGSAAGTCECAFPARSYLWDWHLSGFETSILCCPA